MPEELLYFLPNEAAVLAIRKVFENHYRLSELPRCLIEVQYWDTFDERLRAEEIRLWTEKVAGLPSKLCMGTQDDQRTCMVLDFDPFWASDLSGETFRRKLEPVVAPRPLLRHLKIWRHRHTWVLLDQREKKLLEVCLDDDRSLLRPLRFPGDKPLKSQKGTVHLHLRSVRGYRKPFEELRDSIEFRMGMIPLESDVLYLSCQKLGWEVPNKEGSNIHGIQPEEPASQAVREVLKVQFDIMETNRVGAAWGRDIEFLHDFRVACRRSRSILAQMKSVFPARTLGPLLNHFIWLSGLTGPLRDFDVFLLKMQNHLKQGEFSIEAIQPILNRIQEQRDREQQKFCKALNSHRYGNFRKLFRGFLNRADTLSGGSGKQRGILSFSNRRIFKLFKRALREGLAITEDESYLAFHELRKTCKKLRYLIEASRSLHTVENIRDSLKSLKRFQELLGLMNDHFVQEKYLRQLSNSKDLPASSRNAVQLLAGRYSGRLAESASCFKGVFSEFSSPPRQREWKRLFGKRG